MIYLSKFFLSFTFFSSAYSTRDVSATAGSDYHGETSKTVSFAANSDTTEGSVTILTDTSREDPEVFEISINNPSVGELGNVTKATVTLYDMAQTREFIFCAFFSRLYNSYEIVGYAPGCETVTFAKIVLRFTCPTFNIDFQSISIFDCISTHQYIYFLEKEPTLAQIGRYLWPFPS